MANVIKIKQSATANNEPTTSQIVQGELAINTTDKKLFSSDGTSIFEIGQDRLPLTGGTLTGDTVINTHLGDELVTNGTFDTDLTGWVDTNVVSTPDTSIFANGGMKIVAATTSLTSTKWLLGSDFIIGDFYTATADVYTPSTNSTTVNACIGFVHSGFSGRSVAQANRDVVETISMSFQATATTHTLYASVATTDFSAFGIVGDTAYFDNISVKEVIGSDLTVSGNINLGDSSKAVFGDSNDLQIFHDGGNSWIKDTGTGSLILSGANDVNIKGDNGERMAIFNQNSSVDLFYDNVKKLATTSTGIDVTGNIATNDTLFLDSEKYIQFDQGVSNDYSIRKASDRLELTGDNIVFDADGTEAMRITSTGRVGIGTTSPSRNLHVHTPSGERSVIRIQQAVQNYWDLESPASDTDFTISDVGGEKLRITSTGDIGIGTSSPSVALDVVGNVRLSNQLEFGDTTFVINTANDAMNLQSYSGKDILLQPGGNVGIGTTTPSAKLEVAGTIVAEGVTPVKLDTKEVTETMTYISGATVTPDLDNGTLFRTSGNITVLAVPTIEAGKSFTLFKHATHTLAFSSSYQWSGNLTPTPEATYREIYTFICDGSYWYGMVAGRRML